MNDLILKKDGFYLREWNSEKRKYEPDVLLDNRWLFAWSDFLDGIEGKITLGDIFAILAKLDTHERTLFSALARASGISAYIEEAQKPAARKSDLDYIEVYRYVELSWYRQEGVPNFEYYVSTNGRIEGDPQVYSLDFTPVNELLHCEIRLAPTMRFYDTRNDYNERGEYVRPGHNPPFDVKEDPSAYPTVDGKACTCIQCNGERFSTTYKLGEFFEALFDDICFHGAPAERDEVLGGLLKTVEDCRTGRLETVSLDLDELDSEIDPTRKS